MPALLVSALLVLALFVSGLFVSGLVSGCAKSAVAPPAAAVAARPAVAPPTSTAPAGTLRPLPGRAAAAMFDAATASLAVLDPGPEPATLSVFGAAGVPRNISLPAAVTAMTGDDRGTAYLSGRGGYYRVDLAAGVATRVGVDGEQSTEFTAIARRADGRLVLGSATGAVYTLGSASAVAARLAIFSGVDARVDAIVTQANTAVVLDRAQTSVATVDPGGDRAGPALRAGLGATSMVADTAGRVLVADTRGGELLVFSVDPLILRQAYPVGASPYGLAGTATLAWVSNTAANTVVGYDLSTGIPVEKVRYPTVRQPDSLAFDVATGTLFVVSATGAGVQTIPHAARP